MYGNISYDLLDIYARGKREQLLKEVQDYNLVHQISAAQKQPGSSRASGRAASISVWLIFLRQYLQSIF